MNVQVTAYRPGRVLGSGNISVGRYAAGPAWVYCTLGRVLLGRAGF